DELWAVVGPSPPSSSGERHWARAPAPAGWDVQAATVWVAAHAGTLTAAELPAGGVVEFRDGGTAHVAGPGPAQVGVLGPDSGAALADLLRFAAQG
ncbi:MAG: hypothetical protein M3Q47_08220, partial [Actinomycetota bacterium]|nr:hypothetical protein [Actinomycetota bacterium]